MTASTSVAVGCAVGIPVGVGVIIAVCFWFNLQKDTRGRNKTIENWKGLFMMKVVSCPLTILDP